MILPLRMIPECFNVCFNVRGDEFTPVSAGEWRGQGLDFWRKISIFVPPLPPTARLPPTGEVRFRIGQVQLHSTRLSVSVAVKQLSLICHHSSSCPSPLLRTQTIVRIQTFGIAKEAAATALASRKPSLGPSKPAILPRGLSSRR